MEKILVTTDQSDNSKAAIRFAIKMAKSRNAELIVLHVYHLLKPFKWSDETFAGYIETFKEKTAKELASFIAEIYESINEPEIKYDLVLVSNDDTVSGILGYANKHNCAYICISTRGAGVITKIFGTHTASLIKHSTIPVVCIPSSYHLEEVTHVLYATDMVNYECELEKVVAFARPIHATIEMMHIFYPHEFVYDKEMLESSLKNKVNYDVSIVNRKRDIINVLLEDIDEAIRISKPSVLVLFTDQSKSMFEKMFSPSIAEEYSFYSKIPLLTFNKQLSNQ